MYRKFNTDRNRGFTIIELMLAMTFLSMLLLSIALTTMQLSRIYAKGTTLREVNQVGRATIDDLQRSFAESAPFNVDAASLRYQINQSGQLCLGEYSYVWNSPSSLATGANTLKYSNGSPIYFARIADSTRQYCSSPAVPVPDRKDATELLAAGDHTLVMRNFEVIEGAKDLSSGKGQQLYMLSFQLGTNTGDEEAVTSMSSCKAPVDSGSGMLDYCSVNKFEIIVRAGGGSMEAN